MDGSDNPTAGGLTRATPENQQERLDPRDSESSEAIRQPSHVVSEMKRWSDPYGDVGIDPEASGVLLEETGSSEIPCRVEELPCGRAISRELWLITGKPFQGNPVGSRERMLFDPVTTEAKAEMAFLPAGKSMDAIRRQPSRSILDIPSYISGYVDGEGCFCVSLRPQPRIRVGWEVRPSFSVSQNGDRAELIRLLPHLFGCGTIRPDRSDKTLKFEIRSLGHLTESVIPFFEVYPLLSSKRHDFENFSRVCRLMLIGAHLTCDGILQIAEFASRMNSSGIRRYSKEMIKRDLEVKG